MILGLLSDSHDNMSALQSAVRKIKEEGVSLVLHAGDYVAPFTAKIFLEEKIDVIGVFGNNDGEKNHLLKKYSEVGEIKGEVADLSFNGKKICIYHGTFEAFTDALAKSGSYDVLVTGHTHVAKIEKINKCLVVNPGEVCGYLTGKRSYALLDTEKLEAKILEF
ncbi:MAG: metallophosphoesterase [Candidatus Thermoplasmatota archaeon]